MTEKQLIEFVDKVIAYHSAYGIKIFLFSCTDNNCLLLHYWSTYFLMEYNLMLESEFKFTGK